MSKGSAHYKNEQRKAAHNKERIKKMKLQLQSITAPELDAHRRAMDAKIAALEAQRDLSRIWLHVDMDAFFAAGGAGVWLNASICFAPTYIPSRLPLQWRSSTTPHLKTSRLQWVAWA
jgi:hypothetical protein